MSATSWSRPASRPSRPERRRGGRPWPAHRRVADPPLLRQLDRAPRHRPGTQTHNPQAQPGASGSGPAQRRARSRYGRAHGDRPARTDAPLRRGGRPGARRRSSPSSPPAPPRPAASGSRSPAAWRSRAWPSAAAPGSASARASPRCSRRSRSSARPASACRSRRRSARRCSAASHARGVGLVAAARRLRRCPPAPQRRHHRVLHLGDRRRARRLRRHLRRDRPPGRARGGHRGRARADGGRACWPGRRSRAPCRCWSTGAGCGRGTSDAATTAPRGARAGVEEESVAWRATSPPHPRDSTPGRSPSVRPLRSRCCSVARSGPFLAAVAAWLALAWAPRAAPTPSRFAPASSSPAILAVGALRLRARRRARPRRRAAARAPRRAARARRDLAARGGRRRRACARCRGACSAGCAASRRRPRPPRCSTASPPRAASRRPRGRSPRARRGAQAAARARRRRARLGGAESPPSSPRPRQAPLPLSARALDYALIASRLRARRLAIALR